MNGCDVALATYERRVLQLFKARRWARAWKKAAQGGRYEGDALIETDKDLRNCKARIAELEDALRRLRAALAAANLDLVGVGRWVCECGVSVRDTDKHRCELLGEAK